MGKYVKIEGNWVAKDAKYLTNRVLIMLLLLTTFNVAAQTGRKNSRQFGEAMELFSRQNYEPAREKTEKILEREPDFLDARLLIADIYNALQNTPAEISHLQMAVTHPEAPPLAGLRLADALFSLGKYSEALPYFNRYLTTGQTGAGRMDDVNRKIESCIFAERAIRNPVDFSPQKLPGSINAASDEYWPSLSIDQKQLVFTRLIKRAGTQPQEDFFLSEFSGNEWQEAQPISDINTVENEGAQSLSADGKILFFTACNRPGGIGSCDIYYSFFANGHWSKPYNAGTPLNTPGWEAQPSVSSDGRYLYFSSNRPGGKGNKDIWRAQLKGRAKNGSLEWETPVNVGEPVNTTGNETSPFIHAGNSHFYFASDSHVGMGKFDLYRVQIDADTVFSKLINLGYPVNTHNDEQGLHISANAQTGFYSSSRDGISGLDIYAFELDQKIRPQPATYVKARVYDAETGISVLAEIELVNITKEEERPRYVITDTNGELLMCLPTGNDYLFSVSKPDYLFYSELFDLSEPRQAYSPYDLEIGLIPVKPGAEINLHHIYFETDSFRILPASEPELAQLVRFLQENPGLKIEIQGHTDNTGSTEKNQSLSEKRARSVVDFLVEKGIDDKRLSWAGYGEMHPVADNSSSEGRRLNRRTTLKILSTDKINREK